VEEPYFAAAREGDLDALVAVLDPDVVLRAHRRDADPLELHGAAQVAQGAITARRFAPYVRPALVNGAAGVVAFDGEEPFAVLAFTVIGDRAVAIDVFKDPEPRGSCIGPIGRPARSSRSWAATWGASGCWSSRRTALMSCTAAIRCVRCSPSSSA
jgi:hypothetical protein